MKMEIYLISSHTVQQMTITYGHSLTKLIQIILTFIYHINNLHNFPLKLDSGIIHCRFAFGRNLVLVGVKAGRLGEEAELSDNGTLPVSSWQGPFYCRG